MLIFLIGTILGFIFFLRLVYRFCANKFISIILSSVCGLIIGFALWFFVGGFIGYHISKTEKIEEYKLEKLSYYTFENEEKYLFSGYVDGELVYTYKIGTEIKKIVEDNNSKNVYINEGDYTPIIKIHNKEIKKNWYNLFVNKLFIKDSYIEFFIPENAIIYNN